MEIRILKNPTDKPIEMMYDGRVYIFSPGERKPVEEALAHLATEENNTKLLDITDEPEPKTEPTESKIESNSELSELTGMPLPKLLKLAKSKGLKVKFGMTKKDVISLLINGNSQ